jgi:hypothetical protein
MKKPAAGVVGSEIRENSMKSGFQGERITTTSTADIVTISLSVKKKENKENAAAPEKHAAAVLSEA